jgi:asparagine synthase (glutamine-hydrolysing)
MCGILGVLPSINKNNFLQGLDELTHRGPDGYGLWQSENAEVTLGHRRLSILDLSDCGKQPMQYQHLSITFNGEIYNFVEIKKTLENKGYAFKSNSDTEIILAAFIEWGEKCLQRFNGMWAFAIWDNLKNQLFISRDRYGKKPLFYSFSGKSFVFGSEMKALAPLLKEVRISKDFEWCKNNLYLYENTDKCLVEGIKRFPAGSYAYYKVGDSSVNPIKYWSTIDHLEKVPEKYSDQVDRFRELFEDACKIRMRSDVTIGTALSGGLDSSAIISMLAHINKCKQNEERVSKDWQHAVIATFPGSILDESYYAKKVVDHLGFKGTFIDVDVERSVTKFEDYIYKFEELYTTPPHPMMDTYAAIKSSGVTVSLDGHGADELLSGYSNNLYEAFSDAGLNAGDIRSIIETRYGLVDKKPGLKEYLDYVKYPLEKKIKTGLAYSSRFLPFAKNMRMPVPSPPLIDGIGHFNSLLYQAFHSTVLPTLLRNFDRISMAASVETRMPFLDHRLVSYAFSLPWSSKIRNGFTKSILRDAVAPLLPNEVVYRRSKIGFNTPTAQWIKTGWREFILDTIASKEFTDCSLIDPQKSKRIIQKILKSEKESFLDGYNAWISLSPFLWEKYFFNNLKQKVV